MWPRAQNSMSITDDDAVTATNDDASRSRVNDDATTRPTTHNARSTTLDAPAGHESYSTTHDARPTA